MSIGVNVWMGVWVCGCEWVSVFGWMDGCM